ncbi:class II aldolase/adducin N-terminal [Talaromyces proteolyticus]|uniref:Class II aldolase/adducin N-terminal n=1 Tax=Talaromyces proteolyticus TaxID=1131652 RepID=A0AAD4KLF4_9EURO|nr:class II aldolase/adducin N-terminal [Talaromyces proteolyticus]KAH8690796.1 class II aldolase/adducin N-terminal [Talaromyces proteolyticus]
MAPHSEPETISKKKRLALALRIFAKLDFDEGVAGHITLRDSIDPTRFWVNPFGVDWQLLEASDLILVNKDGQVVDGDPCPYMIHHAVHTARPEINCRPLEIITQDACAFHNDIALYSAFRGIVLAADEGIAISRDLGQKKEALLQNHGLLTCGKTIKAAVWWSMSLEKGCHVQLLADAASGGRGEETVKVSDEDAAFTCKAVGTEKTGRYSAKPIFDMMEHESRMM